MKIKYYINKKLFEKNYPELSFLNDVEKYVSVHDFNEYYNLINIENYIKLERKLKLNKLNNKSDKLIKFIHFVCENSIPANDIFKQLYNINQIKYNTANYKFVEDMKQIDYNNYYYHTENKLNSNTIYIKY